MKKVVYSLGCSWMVPNWNMAAANGSPPETHLIELMKADGIEVIQHASNGSSNSSTIRRALECKTQPTHIIWCQTDPYRDRQTEHGQPYGEGNAHWYLRSAYQDFSKLVRCWPNAKIAVIGGLTPLHVSMYRFFGTRISYIKIDWMKEILDRDIHVQTIISKNVNTVSIPTDGYGYSMSIDKNDVLQWMTLQDLDNAQRRMTAMAMSKLFPDNGHPGDVAHSLLYADLKASGFLT